MSIRAWTFALRQPRHRRDALRALHGVAGDAVDAALAMLLELAPDGRTTLAAAQAFADPLSPRAAEALQELLDHPLSSVRRVAARRLAIEGIHQGRLLDVIQNDPAWPVRAAAIPPDAPEAFVRVLLDDPHWRARLVAAEALEEAMAARPDDTARIQGALTYLRALQDPDAPLPDEPPEDPPPVHWWDPDPMVMRRDFRELSDAEKKRSLPHLGPILSEADAQLRQMLVEALLQWGEPDTLRAALWHLRDPRTPFAQDVVERLSARLDTERRKALCKMILDDPDASPFELSVWMTEDVAHRFLQHPDARVRVRAVGMSKTIEQSLLQDEHWSVRLAALSRLGAEAARLDRSADPSPDVRRQWARFAKDVPRWQPKLRDDPDARVRASVAMIYPQLMDDPDDRVRAAAMTPARAAALWADPTSEGAWRVLTRAASLLNAPLSLIAPPLPQKSIGIITTLPTPMPTPMNALRRPLGETGLMVSPLGLSGHYGLEAAGFAEGIERGVNFFFWERSYTAQTRFFRSLSPARRDEQVVLSGSYDADPKVIRRDAEQALKALGISRLGVYLIFWVRSWRRIDPQVRAVLDELVERDIIACYGLSTHRRGLAVEAIHQGWPVVMVRHSGAHTGAEDRIFPAAQGSGVGLITFSNLCYGRILRDGVTAPDCYRYSLSFPAVQSTLSAPGSLRQLRENLAVMDDLSLPKQRRARLLAVGGRLHRRQRAFAAGVRWR